MSLTKSRDGNNIWLPRDLEWIQPVTAWSIIVFAAILFNRVRASQIGKRGISNPGIMYILLLTNTDGKVQSVC